MDRYHSNFGPLDGTILHRDGPPTMGVYADPDGAETVGIAYPVGQVETRQWVAATFQLVIGEEDLEGRYICWGRVFVRLGEAAEEL